MLQGLLLQSGTILLWIKGYLGQEFDLGLPSQNVRTILIMVVRLRLRSLKRFGSQSRFYSIWFLSLHHSSSALQCPCVIWETFSGVSRGFKSEFTFQDVTRLEAVVCQSLGSQSLAFWFIDVLFQMLKAEIFKPSDTVVLMKWFRLFPCQWSTLSRSWLRSPPVSQQGGGKRTSLTSLLM